MTSNNELYDMANKLRINSLKSTTRAGSGHPTSCLSCAEIMSALFFSEIQENDEFILSKGHAAPILWSVFSETRHIDESALDTLRKLGSPLEGHPTPKMPLIKIATGSLGQGLPAGVGMALGKRLQKNGGKVFVLMGDGESAEGSVWEAANAAAYYKLNNLCLIIDVNRLGQSGPTMHEHDIEKYENKFRAFGWNTVAINGHDIEDLLNAFSEFRKSDKPFAIIARTIKGKGVSFLEDKNGWHGKSLNEDQLDIALKEIGTVNVASSSNFRFNERSAHPFNDSDKINYGMNEMVSTREAFGKALVNIGKNNKNIIALDADVKNSTKKEYFFNAYPERSFQSFIAEQNMVGMAMGLSALGFNPFVSTFSAFLTRAHDFIRMAQYSDSNIKFVGSHSGISIGQDGPSQMGLEDLSLFLSKPRSVVLYPCDAVSAQYLTSEMAKYEGIVYMRTARNPTSVIYDNSEEFPIGGLKVVRKSENDKALVIAAGVTLHESLKAYEELRNNNVNIRVIDLYSLRPIDKEALIRNASECGNRIITVEDHYPAALGWVVQQILNNVEHLYINDIPSSGDPDDLLHAHKINAKAIIDKVEAMK
jgi:transketolase